MKRVTRGEVRNKKDYEAIRDNFRGSVLKQKELRRVHVGANLTFLFENHDTVLYQVQEMLRAEGTSAESDILHEIETYNELLGDKGELGCTLLVEIEDAEKRAELLSRWVDLPTFIYIEAQDGTRIPATFDPRQVGTGRISSVQYIKFKVGDKVPRKVGCSHPDIASEAVLSPEQIAALCMDLL